jgi:ADP-heptose:LPS heptosyltransferase
MDVVIATDTTLGHLAAAMGKPTLMILPQSADWCWMLNRADSPWYPTVKLFRQSESQTWGDVITAVAAELGR